MLARLDGPTALVEEQFAKAHDVGVGDTYAIETPSGGRTRLEVLGVYRDPHMLLAVVVGVAAAVVPARRGARLQIIEALGVD
jgi:hypothetical protein